jgi:hypothetical protein
MIDVFTWVAPCTNLSDLNPDKPSAIFLASVNYGPFHREVEYSVTVDDEIVVLAGQREGNWDCDTEETKSSSLAITPRLPNSKVDVRSEFIVKERHHRFKRAVQFTVATGEF